MSASGVRRREFEVGRIGIALRGDEQGEGETVLLCHGLSATRDLVIHNSRAIPRAGRRLVLWDARGHGTSDPAPAGEGYGYERQVEDLEAIVEGVTDGDQQVIIGGHSMGCHTAAAWALANPARVSGLILIGPVFTGAELDPAGDRWDARAEALAEGGPEAFAEVAAEEFTGSEEVRTLVERLALDRTRRHLHPEAVADALREVPRSMPFAGLSSLSALHAPALVVGSRDDLDPGHPLEIAEAWAETIPGARLVVEEPGESPLAWQGGRLSRVINEFLDGRDPQDGGRG